MSILFSFHWCCHSPPVWPPSSPLFLLLLLDALPDTCNPLMPWTEKKLSSGEVTAVDSEAVYREGCGGWGRHNLILALSQIEDVDIVSLCAGKEAVFPGKNRLGTFPIPSRWRACTVGWSTRWHQLPLFPWRWGPCHSPGLTRPDTRGPLRGETRSPAETEIHYKYSIIFLWKKQLTSKLEVCWFTVKPARAHPIFETSRSWLNLYPFPGLGLGGLNGMFSS